MMNMSQSIQRRRSRDTVLVLGVAGLIYVASYATPLCYKFFGDRVAGAVDDREWAVLFGCLGVLLIVCLFSLIWIVSDLALCDRVPQYADAADFDFAHVSRLEEHRWLARETYACRRAREDQVTRLQSDDLRYVGD